MSTTIRTKDDKFYFQGTDGSFYKTMIRRGIGFPRPLDLGSTTEIRSSGRERGRAGHGRLVFGAHGLVARVGRGDERQDARARIAHGWGHGWARPTGHRHGASVGAGTH
jgi:hypothetical protein